MLNDKGERESLVSGNLVGTGDRNVGTNCGARKNVRSIVSIQVSGDVPTLPSLRPKVQVGVDLVLGFGLREGRVDLSPEILDRSYQSTNLCFVQCLHVFGCLSCYYLWWQEISAGLTELFSGDPLLRFPQI